MSKEELKLKRLEYLGACLRKFTTSEPELSLEEIAFVIAEEIPDLTEFFKKYKKELKRGWKVIDRVGAWHG